jgi:hypothetical protein
MLALLLLAVTLLPAPTGYESAVTRVPARHWRLVQAATIDRDSGGQARRATMSIHLTPYDSTGRGDAQLVHEVGHIVYYADPALERDWRARFARGETRNTASERFADTYTEMVLTGCPDSRSQERWLRERVFRDHEYPCRSS